MPSSAFPVILAGFAAFLDLYATQPLLPLLARTFHASTFDVSLTVTAPTIGVAIAAPIVGRLADRWGLRRVIVGSAFALAAATGLAATSQSLFQLVVWRFVQGVVTPGIFGSTIAYIHEQWPASRVGRTAAAYVSGTVIGGFSGRAIAGLVAGDHRWPLSFVVLAVLNGAVAAALAMWLPQERGPLESHTFRTKVPAFEHFRNRRLVATYIVGFCVLFTQVAMFTYVIFHLAAAPYFLSTVQLGWLFVVYLVGAIVTPFAGQWIDRYGHRTGIGLAMVIGATGALSTLAPWLPAIIGGLALTATGVFIAQASASSYIGAVTTRDRALAVGFYSTFYYTGGSAGGALPALFWNSLGWPGCVGLVVLVQLLGSATAFTQWAPASVGGEGTVPETGV